MSDHGDDTELRLDVTPWKATVALVGAVVVIVALVVLLRPDGSGGGTGGGATTAPTTPSVPPVPTAPAPAPPSPSRLPGTTGGPRTEGGLPSAGPSPSGGSRPVCVRERDDADLRVLVANIKAGQVGGLERVARLIELARPDVALLQEVDQSTARTGRVDQPSVLGDRLRMAWGYGRNIRFGGGSYGTAILSKYPLADLANIALPNASGEEQRGLLRATITIDEVTISLYNTHLEAGPVSRLRQAQMRRIAEVVRADDNPVIFGGDLNAGPSAPEIGIARSVLVDTWASVGTGSGNTVPAGSPRARIDYTFHSADTITPVSSTVLEAVVSDHRAILSDYVVPGVETKTCVDLPLPGSIDLSR